MGVSEDLTGRVCVEMYLLTWVDCTTLFVRTFITKKKIPRVRFDGDGRFEYFAGLLSSTRSRKWDIFDGGFARPQVIEHASKPI